MYIPDPSELMDSRIDRLSYEWNVAQKYVPKGSFRCPYCNNIYEGDPIHASSSPDSAAMCYECLPDDVKLLFDKWEDSL